MSEEKMYILRRTPLKIFIKLVSKAFQKKVKHNWLISCLFTKKEEFGDEEVMKEMNVLILRGVFYKKFTKNKI